MKNFSLLSAWFRCVLSRGTFCFLGVLMALAVTSGPAAAADDDWPMFGQNLQNTANAPKGVKDVSRLSVKWTFTTGGDVSARAAVVDKVAYFPDWGGNLWAVDTKKGNKVWGRKFTDYGLSATNQSRTTPAVIDGVVYIGMQQGAWLLAISAETGNLLWKTQLETADPLAVITTSPVVQGGLLYTGVASLQEGAAANPAFPCCNARGSVVAVSVKGANRGQILWKTYMVPPGYSGGGVWGGNFVVDPVRGSVFVSTGNNYAHPTDPAYVACVVGGGTAAACQSPSNHVDSVLALDMSTGAIKWASRQTNWQQPFVADGTDDWNVACLIGFAPGQGNCPTSAGPDYDFASAPNLISYVDSSGRKQTILGAGQKSGIYFALNPDTGAVIWRTQVGPGSALGGMEWGSASDGKRIYVSIANLYGIPTAVGGAGLLVGAGPGHRCHLVAGGRPQQRHQRGAGDCGGGCGVRLLHGRFTHCAHNAGAQCGDRADAVVLRFRRLRERRRHRRRRRCALGLGLHAPGHPGLHRQQQVLRLLQKR